MIARSDYWYYIGSTGWWDDSYTWNDLYDKVSFCGLPEAPASRTGAVVTRRYEHCKYETLL